MLFQYDKTILALIIGLIIYHSISVIVTKWLAGTKEWNDSWGIAIILNLVWFVVDIVIWSFGILGVEILDFEILSFEYWLFGIIGLTIYLVLNALAVMKLHDREFVESLIFFFGIIVIISLGFIIGVFFIAFVIGVIWGVVTLLGKVLGVLLGNSSLVYISSMVCP
ncbi:MAG: hypothetical protein ACFFBD_17810 [Candidatus Hodarchaeota archaeon]